MVNTVLSLVYSIDRIEFSKKLGDETTTGVCAYTIGSKKCYLERLIN